MPEIGTSGSMSGDGKRSVGHGAPSNRAHPRLYRLGRLGCCSKSAAIRGTLVVMPT
jgi:hypothetical protein